ncbi:hypothetical protein EVAR_98456_1 [Eumeta japonica]|uniref:Uncharacterized protein n=1 Tax=Eumeta variegata TaxID=151549 RepID=A0A4C1YS07_EUMVA|nr:hypothetical protein EVAR_98456_1 [Eumeta japonica]
MSTSPGLLLRHHRRSASKKGTKEDIIMRILAARLHRRSGSLGGDPHRGRPARRPLGTWRVFINELRAHYPAPLSGAVVKFKSPTSDVIYCDYTLLIVIRACHSSTRNNRFNRYVDVWRSTTASGAGGLDIVLFGVGSWRPPAPVPARSGRDVIHLNTTDFSARLRGSGSQAGLKGADSASAENLQRQQKPGNYVLRSAPSVVVLARYCHTINVVADWFQHALVQRVEVITPALYLEMRRLQGDTSLVGPARQHLELPFLK